MLAAKDTSPSVMRLCIIEPLLTIYDYRVYIGLSEYFRLDVVYSPVDRTEGFGNIPTDACHSRIHLVQVPTVRPFGSRIGMFQRGVGKYLIRERPDSVVIFANLRYLSFWHILVLCRLLRIRVYARGHGLFKKTRTNAVLRAAYRAALSLVDAYICYTPSVKRSLQQHGCAEAKLHVAENSLVNDCCVTPSEKVGTETGILVIGRLRKNCHVDLLLKTVARLTNEGLDL